MAEPWDWRRVGRLFAWMLAGGLFLGTVIFALIAFDVIGPEPPRRRIPDLVDRIFRFFEDESEIWPLELSSRLLFVIGFLGLGGLGIALGRILDRDSPGATAVSGFFGLAAILGVVAELSTIGVKQVAIGPQYCECKYAPEELIGRDQILYLAQNAEEWMYYGLFLLSAAGLYALGRIALSTGRFNRGWGYLSYLIAALFLLGILTQVFDFELVYDLTVAIGGGLLVPAWAIWLAQQLRRERGPTLGP